ncbi:hypothetical protein Tco_1156262 [Tanacetum coccineum]
MKDRVIQNNSQVKKKDVEDHRRNFKFSNIKTSITACNDSLNAKISNVNFVCVTCGKCVFNENHDSCVLHYINGMNSRTKNLIVVPISTRETKRTMNQSVVTLHKRTVASKSTIQKSRSRLRMLYENISKTCKWWYTKFKPPGYKWEPKSKTRDVNTNVSLPLGTESRNHHVHHRLGVHKAHDKKYQASNNFMEKFLDLENHLLLIQSASWLKLQCLKHGYGIAIYVLLVSWVKQSIVLSSQKLPQAERDDYISYTWIYVVPCKLKASMEGSIFLDPRMKQWRCSSVS